MVELARSQRRRLTQRASMPGFPCHIESAAPSNTAPAPGALPFAVTLVVS